MKSMNVFARTVSLLIFLLLSIVFSCAAMAEENTWECPQCGRKENRGNYCGTCAHPAPWMDTEEADPEVWVCPVCGAANTDKFCPQDGTPRPDPWVCPVCGQLNNDRFCPKDGTERPDAAGDGSDDAAGPDVPPENSLPVFSESFTEAPASLRLSQDSDYRVYTFSGPGRNYMPTGGYKPSRTGIQTTAYFAEDEWVYCYVRYTGVEDRCVYIKESAFTSLDPQLPVLGEYDSYSGVTVGTVLPGWGPSPEFNVIASKPIEDGTPIRAFFQENGYVYAELVSSGYTMRAWLPADQVSIPGVNYLVSEGIGSQQKKSNWGFQVQSDKAEKEEDENQEEDDGDDKKKDDGETGKKKDGGGSDGSKDDSESEKEKDGSEGRQKDDSGSDKNADEKDKSP